MFIPTYLIREEQDPEFPALFNWNIYFYPISAEAKILVARRISQFHAIMAAKAIAFDTGYGNKDCKIISISRTNKQEIHVGG